MIRILLTALLAVWAAPVLAQQAGKELLRVEGELTEKDPRDKLRLGPRRTPPPLTSLAPTSLKPMRSTSLKPMRTRTPPMVPRSMRPRPARPKPSRPSR